ncbi:16S rRNA (guanine(966)-N(2))-methyltransferase RsmD [Parasphingopyxis sp.]|uniref:16S rRNA (guanine(966)-N(2))-methyltransferase RsmD n=1 Tax=Parasphingopyxis sp. TaxID=1920299 RepID=UPI00262607E5|nr:16S rRNA (guanine(966)-N(2))-methyltransferase RsmD [Parasphingopyxis sp.]
MKTSAPRIVAGKWKGQPIETPQTATTRPTSARTREALFSMLLSRIGNFEDLTVADIFAGSGALGFEALSRGAATCIFVENSSDALRAIRTNADKWGADITLLDRSFGAVTEIPESVDIAFLDPPYLSGDGQRALARLDRLGWFAPHTWAALETAAEEEVAVEGWTEDATRTYGKAKLTLLRRN